MSNFNKQVLKPLFHSLEIFKSNTAFVINNEKYSYTDLILRISNIRTEVAKFKDDNIALVANNDLETYAAIIALWAEGKCYVPLHPTQPLERCREILNQVGTNIVLDSSLKTRYNVENVIHLKSISLEKCCLELKKEISDSKFAYLLFTSGSTGKPKGVPVSRGNVASFVNAFYKQKYKLGNKDRCLQMFDLTFDLSVQSYLMPLLAGATIFTVPITKLKYNYIFELLDEQNITFALMVPSVIHYLRPYMNDIIIPTMRYSLFCGEALNIEDVSAWSKCVPNARIDNVYGPTENTIYCTSYTYQRNTINKELNGVMCIGKAMVGTETIIIDENNCPLDTGTKGELCLAGEQLTPGYWKNNKKNAEAFFIYNGRRFYHTGDLCEMDAEGDINYCGRIDFQVKIQGYRIELGEIEYHARQFLNGKNVICVPIKSKTGMTEIVLCIEHKKEDAENLLNYLQSKLPAYMIPSAIIYVPIFPLNINGKIDRKVLLQKIEKN